MAFMFTVYKEEDGSINENLENDGSCAVIEIERGKTWKKLEREMTEQFAEKHAFFWFFFIIRHKKRIFHGYEATFRSELDH